MFTKHLAGAGRVEKLLEMFGCVFREGLPESAPGLRMGTGSGKGELLEVSKGRWADLTDDVET